MIVVTSYTKHGWEIDSAYTMSQVQDYLGTFFSSLDMGGDLNRSPEELIGRGISIPAQAHTPKGEGSTCAVGGMIDYFLTPPQNQCQVEQRSMIRGTPIKPHYPVQIQVNQRPHLTKVLGPVGARICVELEPIHTKPAWEEAT